MMSESDPATTESTSACKVDVESVEVVVMGDKSDPATIESNINNDDVENLQLANLVRVDESDPSTIEPNAIKVDVNSVQVAGVIGCVDNSYKVKSDAVANTAQEEFETANASERNGGMTQNVTDVPSQSFRSKEESLFTCVRVASIVYFVSVVILLWNEVRTVKSYNNLDNGRETVLEFDVNNFTNTSIPTIFENQLIHAIGNVTTSGIVTDPIFGVSSQYNVTSNVTSQSSDIVKFLKLSRTIRMYQWKEYSKNNLGDPKTWSTQILESPYRRKKNPRSFPFQTITLEANPVYFGNKIELNEEVVSSFSWYAPLGTIDISNVPDPSLRNRLTKFSSNGFFYQADNTTMSSFDQPNIGDVMITFEVMVPDTTSVITCLYPDIDQDGYHNLGSHITNRGGEILLIERGRHTTSEMFIRAENKITASAKKLRIWGYVLMVVSILLFIAPTLEDTFFGGAFIPYMCLIFEVICGYFECFAVFILTFPFIVAGIVAIPNFLFVVSLVWIAYQPAKAVPVMLGSLCFIVYFAWKIPKRIEECHNSLYPEKNSEVSTDNVNESAPPESFLASNSLTGQDSIMGKS